MFQETNIHIKSVKALFKKLNEFETSFLSIDYLAHNGDYIEVYSFIFKD